MRRYILMFIICISSFMFYINNVKATTLSAYKHYNDNYITCNPGYDWCEDNVNIFTSNTSYQGKVYFSFISDPQVVLRSVSLSNEYGTYYNCDIGTTTIFSDNTTGYNVISAVCPVYIFNNGITKVRFEYEQFGNSGFKFNMGDYWTLTTDGSSIDYTTLINAINNNLTSFNSEMNVHLNSLRLYANNTYYKVVDIYDKLDSINNKLDDIKNNSSSTASNTQEIKDKINDSSIDNNNATGTINSLSGQLASDNTITSLLLLPINFINVLIDGLSGECVPYSLGELWGSEIILPCVNLYNTFGVIWYMVDTGLSALVIFKMSKYFIRLFNKLTNLKDGGLEEAYS